MSTWYDLKLAVLQKMFAADDVIIEDESTLGYIAAMPHCANEGLALLATAGKFITKSVKIAQMKIDNLVGESEANIIHEFSDGYSYQTDVDGSIIDTLTIETTGYEPFRGLISNIDKKPVKFEFITSYPMGLKNIAIYGQSFEEESDVPPFTEKIRYDMTALAPDFYMIDPQGIFFEGEYQKYLQISDFYQEGTKNLVLDRSMIGNFTVYYRAYPEQFTKETEDDYELPIDPEVYALLPLYMASQLYLDDDAGVATQYRNSFEVGFERLVNSANLLSYEHFTSDTGWI